MRPGRAPASAAALACLGAVVVLFGNVDAQRQGGQQLCPIQDLDQFDDIARICCESSTGAADCSNGFPTICTRECAALLEPFWTSCGTLVELLGDTFACDEVALDQFAKHECHHTNLLFEHAAVGVCPAEMLEAWTDDVNAACCEQNGVFQCAEGVPWVCDAECALEFGPYWENCMLASGTSSSADLASFAGLYDSCKNLPANENNFLLRTVNDLMEETFCRINTTAIISRDQANAACSVDSSPYCGQSLESGLFTCEADYCLSCAQAHSCDNSCGLPCVGQGGGPALGPAAVPENICNSDSSNRCGLTISAGIFTCEHDYCLTCAQAHACDNTCSLPCGDTAPPAPPSSGGGHRRGLSGSVNDQEVNFTAPVLNRDLHEKKRRRTQHAYASNATTELRGGIFTNPVLESSQCALEDFVSRATHVSHECCIGDACANGLPDECTFECSRFYIPFLMDCNNTMQRIYPHRTFTEYVAFGGECSRMETMSMVRAIVGAHCTTCGDNITELPIEQCDDGANNSYAPNSCRPGCVLPSCGDGVTDTFTEECDDGELNADDAACKPDCRRHIADPHTGRNVLALIPGSVRTSMWTPREISWDSDGSGYISDGGDDMYDTGHYLSTDQCCGNDLRGGSSSSCSSSSQHLTPYDEDFQERGPSHNSCFGPDGVYYMGKNAYGMVLAAKNGHPTSISFMITGNYGGGNQGAAWTFQRGPYRGFASGYGSSSSSCTHHMFILSGDHSPDAYYHVDRCHNWDYNCQYVDQIEPGAELLYIMWKTNQRGNMCYDNDAHQRFELFFNDVMDTLGVPRPDELPVVQCPFMGTSQDQDFQATYSDPLRRAGSTANYDCTGNYGGSYPTSNGEMTCQPDGTWLRPGQSRNGYMCCSSCIQCNNNGNDYCCVGTCRSSYDGNTVGHSSCQNCPHCDRNC